MKKIKISTDFSETPIGRYSDDGPFSGQIFREKFLVPELKKGKKFIVNIDDAEGYGSSFLEEAFGGLVRKEGFTHEQLNALMIIESKDPVFTLLYIPTIEKYIKEARPESKMK